MRYRNTGILFYLAVVLSLGATQEGQCFIRNLLLNAIKPDVANVFELVVAVFSLGIGVFTSDAVGFVLNTVFFFFWENVGGRLRPGEGGYSKQLEECGYDLRGFIISEYDRSGPEATGRNDLHQKFEKQWTSYSANVFLSFIWHHAPKYIDDWVTRRYNVFFTHWSSLVGIVLGFILSIALIWTWHLHLTCAYFWIVIVAVGFVFIFYRQAQYAKHEALQMHDLWVAGVINPRLRRILRKIGEDASTDPRKPSE